MASNETLKYYFFFVQTLYGYGIVWSFRKLTQINRRDSYLFYRMV